MTIKIKTTNQLPLVELETLIKESENQNILFVRRLVDDWISSANCFNKTGEFFLVAEDEDRLIGFCGLNIDPYCQIPNLGRIRHLYVRSPYRRQGIGSQLIKQIIEKAIPYFNLLNLRTDSNEADKFYLARGFKRSYERPECTHIINLTF